jgi:hypothetical protein
MMLPSNLLRSAFRAAEFWRSTGVSWRGKVERSVYILISRLGIKVFMEPPVAIHSCGSAALVNAAALAFAFAFAEDFEVSLISSRESPDRRSNRMANRGFVIQL